MKTVVPQKNFRVLLVYPNLTMMLVPSLAMGIFTALFKNQGYSVDLFDTTHYVVPENSSPQNRVKLLQAREFNEENDLGIRVKNDLLGDYQRKVKNFQPNLIVYSVVEDCYLQTLALMGSIADRPIPHIVGGVFPTAAPNICISNELISVVGIGEGERILIQMAEALRNHESIDDIPGLWVKKSDRIIKNSRPPLSDINRPTPDFSLFNTNRFNRPMGGKIFRTIPIETYRGCPYRCTYCNSPMQVDLAKSDGLGSFLRRKSASVIRDEIAGLIAKYSPEFLYFIDDSFTARPRKEVDEFCKMYEEFQLPFWFNTRAEATDCEMLTSLREVGAYRLSLGIESGNEEYRQKVLKRRPSNKDLRAAILDVAKSYIPFSLNLIIGLPGETRERIFDTVNFVKTVDGYDSITVSIFTPYHGTELRKVAVKNNWLDTNYITKHTTSSSALRMPPPYVSSQEIDNLMRVLPLYVYFPESEWAELQRAEIDDEMGNKILESYANVYRRDFLKDTQFDDKTLIDSGTGCRSNVKDAYRISCPTGRKLPSNEKVSLTI